MIKFRPHHFLCTLGFQGKGYSPGFVENFQMLADRLRENPMGDSVKIQAVASLDSICAPCPHKREHKCATEDKIQILDKAHSDALKIKPGDTITWGEAKSRISKNISPELFHKICKSCSWRSLGVCESALMKLKSKEKNQPLQNALIFFILLISTSTAFANQIPREQPTEKKIEIQEWVKELVKKKPSSLAKVYVALEKSYLKNPEKFCSTQTHALLQKAQNKEWGDHALALWGECFPWVQSKAELRRAGELLDQVPNKYLYSPWRGTDTSGFELLRANVWWKLGTAFSPANLLAAERGLVFGVALGQTWLDALTTEAIRKFSQACVQKPSATCKAWSMQIQPDGPFAQVATQPPEDKLKNKVSQKYRTEEVDYEAWEKMWELYLTDRYEDFFRECERFLIEYSRSELRFRVRYWWALGLKKVESNSEKSKTLFSELLKEAPFSYYGMLSAWQLGVKPDSALGTDLLLVDKNKIPNLGPGNSFRWNRAVDLLRAGSTFFAQRDFQDFPFRENTDPISVLQVIEVLSLAKAHGTSFQWIGELLKRNYPEYHQAYFLKKIFPIEFEEKIKKTSEEAQLNPLFVLSLIKQESAFNPKAKSTAQALGLMQLLFSTAKTIKPVVQPSQLFQPETNIEIGVEYLKKLETQYDGNLAFVAAAYNAGPSRMTQWKKTFEEYPEGKRDFQHFVEFIPFKETQGYVSTIFRNIFWYAHLRIENGYDSKEALENFYFNSRSSVKR